MSVLVARTLQTTTRIKRFHGRTWNEIDTTDPGWQTPLGREIYAYLLTPLGRENYPYLFR